MYVCSNHLISFFLQHANNPGVPALVTDASCQPGWHSHPGATCHPINQRHNNQVRMQMGGEMAYLNFHPQERAMAAMAMQKQQVRCPPGEHTHLGSERCHNSSGTHRGRARQAMGGDAGYFRLHPHARPKETSKKPTRGTKGKPDTKAAKKPSPDAAEKEGWKQAKETARAEGLELQPLKRKIEKIEAKKASTEPLLRELKGKNAKQRMLMIKELVPKNYREDPNTIVNPSLLKGNNVAKLLKENWLVRWTTEYKGSTNQNTIYSKYHYDMTEKAKWSRVRSLAKQLPRLNRSAMNDVKSDNVMSNDFQNGAAMLLLMKSGFRPGGEKYAAENGTFGITSLRRGDIKVMSGDKVKLSFVGKKQQKFDHTVSIGKPAHTAIKKLLAEKGKPTDKLFPYVSEKTVHNYVQRFDSNLKPKDFRTLSVNKEVFKMMNNIKGLKTDWDRDLAAKRIIKAVSQRHGHQEDAAIRSYIHPMVLRAFIDGHKLPVWQGISKMLFKAENEDTNYLEDMEDDERNFIEYLSSIHVV